mmetsp:Transcript_13272/g.32582  ORF Transcript_13272/g.32582 Transcript_13272/m.32582 type:complete len:287 (+) Transcript_13272:764-1624(+)
MQIGNSRKQLVYYFPCRVLGQYFALDNSSEEVSCPHDIHNNVDNVCSLEYISHSNDIRMFHQFKYSYFGPQGLSLMFGCRHSLFLNYFNRDSLVRFDIRSSMNCREPSSSYLILDFVMLIKRFAFPGLSQSLNPTLLSFRVFTEVETCLVVLRHFYCVVPWFGHVSFLKTVSFQENNLRWKGISLGLELIEKAVLYSTPSSSVPPYLGAQFVEETGIPDARRGIVNGTANFFVLVIRTQAGEELPQGLHLLSPEHASFACEVQVRTAHSNVSVGRFDHVRRPLPGT